MMSLIRRMTEIAVCVVWAAGLRVWFLYVWLLAFFRLSDEAVCRVAEWGWDYHDYPDGTLGIPEHFIPHTCKRCGKDFWI